MSAIDDFTALIGKTEIMEQVTRSLREEPAHLLANICREYEEAGQPVPDHHLHFSGYIGEASLKALLAAGLIKQQPGGRLSLYCYQPTESGLEQYQNLENDGFYHK
jgi:hypothetical protein